MRACAILMVSSAIGVTNFYHHLFAITIPTPKQHLDTPADWKPQWVKSSDVLRNPKSQLGWQQRKHGSSSRSQKWDNRMEMVEITKTYRAGVFGSVVEPFLHGFVTSHFRLTGSSDDIGITNSKITYLRVRTLPQDQCRVYVH